MQLQLRQPRSGRVDSALLNLLHGRETGLWWQQLYQHRGLRMDTELLPRKKQIPLHLAIFFALGTAPHPCRGLCLAYAGHLPLAKLGTEVQKCQCLEL